MGTNILFKIYKKLLKYFMSNQTDETKKYFFGNCLVSPPKKFPFGIKTSLVKFELNRVIFRGASSPPKIM